MKTLILGGAVSGRAAAGLAASLGHEVVGYDVNPTVAASLRSSTDSWAGGEWTTDLLKGVDLVVTSPGLSPASPPIQDTLSAGVTLWSELEFGARNTTATLAAVTGSNGKTSTATAAFLMLEASGVKACAAGNIGAPLSDVVHEPWDVIVVEASSFQLWFTDGFHPRAAAILNVTSDHLDWHGSAEDYLAAKARITANQIPSDLLAFGADDAGASRAAASSRAELVPISGSRVPPGGIGAIAGKIDMGTGVFTAPDLGTCFLADLVAAAVIARKVGATEDGISIGLSSFRLGPHRRTVIGEWDGVRWVDDSKATNPHAAIASADAFGSVVLIAGGQNKGLDLSPMTQIGNLRHVFSIGETAEELARIFQDRSITVARTLDVAVAGADDIALPGDTVLLAPGCASFDMFASYAERGNEFRRLVLARKTVRDGN
jgi:UDP-N-acetylmuramoylalanine--D-glutamate ligase